MLKEDGDQKRGRTGEKRAQAEELAGELQGKRRRDHKG